jgi:hypothetical protein
LHSAGRGKLTNLECLARVVHCLLANRIVPYAVFDASFRYRTAENSIARTTFDYLTHNVKEFFQKAPSGEEADLFLIEMASATGHPIISNDLFTKYGGAKNAVLRYKGSDIAVYNYHVMAGTVIMPDLDIRYRVQPGDDSLDDIERALADTRNWPEEDALPPAQPAPATPPPSSRRASPGTTSGPRPAAAAAEGAGGLDRKALNGIDRIIRRYLDGGAKPLPPLGARLAGHKRNYQVANGVGKRGRKVWFGYPTLKDFVAASLPQYRLDGDSIEAGPEGGE